MKIHVNNLINESLDWAVAKSKGLITGNERRGMKRYFLPTTNWAQGGPIIEQEQICIWPEAHDGEIGTELSTNWLATIYYDGGEQYTLAEPAPSALVAAMRCYVVSVLGETIDIPDWLISSTETA